MAAVVVEIADAVVAAINTLDGGAFGAQRAYVPVYDVKDLVEPRVTVVPASLTAAILDRTPRHLFDHVIDVAYQRKMPQGSQGQADIITFVDPLMAAVQRIVDLLRATPLTLATAGTVRCVAVANLPIFDPAHLDQLRVFTSVMSFTYRLGR